jgi:HEAT repeat protein
MSIAFMAAWSLSLAIAAAPPVRQPSAGEFKEAAKRLARTSDVKTKLGVLEWLYRNAKAANAGLAIPALEKAVRADPDDDVRCRAILALGWIAKYLNKPCPLAIIEALLDKDDGVVSYAGIASNFRTFERGSVKVLLRCVQSEREMVRGNTILLLLAAGGKDKSVLEVIEKASQDKSFGVRHNAHVAMFKANDRLDDFLHWIIRVYERVDRPSDPERAEKEQTSRDLAILGMAQRIVEWRDKRPEALSKALVKLLDDKSPPIRRGAARLIGPVYLKNPHEETSTEKSACAPHLEKLKAEERLQKLRDGDPDTSVRAAARLTLKQLKRVRQKDRY